MARTATDPIGHDWKISEVLARHPELLETLIAMSPRFQHLRNPLLRRVQARLVTVAQAARVGGVDAAWMVETLNRAAGLAQESADVACGVPDAPPDAAPPEWVEGLEVAEDLDVRAYHARGEEPFSAIMAAARRVPAGRALRLRNTFDPAPLYEALRKQGFEGWGRPLGPEDWEILFLRSDRELRGETRPAPGGPPRTVTLDVSDMVPPEPMVRILAELEALPPGSVLLIRHSRRPLHLYPRLDELGCRHETREEGPNRVEIRIEKPGASAS